MSDYDDIHELEPLEDELDKNNSPSLFQLVSKIREAFNDSHITLTNLISAKNIHLPLFLIDNELRIIAINSCFEKNFGSEKKEYLSIFNHYNDEEERKILLQALSDEAVGYCWNGRSLAKTVTGMEILTRIILLPLKQDNSIPKYWIGSAETINKEYKEVLQKTFLSLLEASKLKDNDTGNHNQRVNRYSKYIAELMEHEEGYLEINVDFIEDISFLGALHDVGKIGVPDDILNKKGKLETWERDIMKEHTKNGAFLLDTYPNPMAKDIALFHHERWNGEGYPYSIAGDMIPISARIVSIADVYDALRSKRSYKEPWTHDKAMEEIIKLSGEHFDPTIIKKVKTNNIELNNIYEILNDDINESE